MRLSFCLLFVCLHAFAFAQMPDQLARRVDFIFLEYDKTNTPGCALAILKDGKIIYERGYGMSNMEYNIAINPTSVFHIASISKQFTAAALVRLSLEGKLSLDDDVRKYIPEMPDFGHTITLNNLIHHTSGLRDQWDLQRLAGWRADDVITEKDIMDMLSRQRALNFLPGEEYVYCNTGFTLAGVVVKKVTGVSLRQYADSVFFKPLGMNSTHFHSDHAEITPNRTSAYAKDEQGRWKISIPVFDNYGATSLFTTVEDLAKWDENFYAKKIGGDDFVDAMRKTATLNDKTPQTYASGLVLSNYRGYRTEGHAGADAGYRSHLLRFPEEHFSVIIFANFANANPSMLSFKVADLFLKDKNPTPTIVATDTSIVKGWAGEYFDATTQTSVKLDYRMGRLTNGPTELVPMSNSAFNAATSVFTFSGDAANAALDVNTKGSKIRKYTKTQRISLSTQQLGEYQGEFYSPELDTKYRLTVKDSSLLIAIPRGDEIQLAPFTKDIFGQGLVLRFSRDKRNAIDGFFLSTGRSRNLRFEKLTKK